MEHCGIVGKVADMQGTVLYAAGPGVRVVCSFNFDASEAPMTFTGPRLVMLLRSYLGPGTRSDVCFWLNRMPSVYAGALSNFKTSMS